MINLSKMITKIIRDGITETVDVTEIVNAADEVLGEASDESRKYEN